MNNLSLDSQDLKTVLHAWQQGNAQAQELLFNKLFTELNNISKALLANEGGISLSAGDLVNEATLRLLNAENIDLKDKAHFLALSSKVMRNVLIDHSRKKNAQKRFHQRVTLVTNIAESENEAIDFQLLEEALQELQEIDPDKVRIVEMRYYGGLSLQQIADVMKVSESTTKRSWRAARAWLLHALDNKTIQE